MKNRQIKKTLPKLFHEKITESVRKVCPKFFTDPYIENTLLDKVITTQKQATAELERSRKRTAVDKIRDACKATNFLRLIK